MDIAPETYAAQIRVIGSSMGMLTHPDRNLVGGGYDWKPTVRNLVRGLYRCSPMTWRELRAYAVAYRSRMQVKMSTDGTFRFSYKE